MEPDDALMAEIHEAVALRCGGGRAESRERLLALWARVGDDGDPLHRCALAHFLADAADSPAASLRWNLAALAAADALTDERARRHHASLSARSFYPSLHLNLAEDHRALGDLAAARRHLALGETSLAALDGAAPDPGLRAALDGLRARLASTPGDIPSTPTPPRGDAPSRLLK
jgi:hypothetical protein